MSAGRTVASTVFRLLVRLWPEDLRRDYGASAAATFAARLEAARRRGRARLLAVATRELVGAAGLGLRSRVSRRRPSRLPVPGAAAGGGIGHDLRFALRTLRRHPGFSTAVLAMLCLGIGLNVASAGLLDAVLVRPLPFPDAGRLVALISTVDGEPTRFGNVSWMDLQDYRASLAAFTDLGGVNGPRTVAATFADHPEVSSALFATPELFATLGVVPVLGRLLRPADQETGDVVLLTRSTWVRRYGGDPGAVGRSVSIDGSPHRIVGVVPDSVAVVAGATELWLPYLPAGESRGSRNLTLVGRLAAGVPIAEAQSRVDAVAAARAARYPDSNVGLGALVRTLHEQIVGDATPRILLLLEGGALAVLLIVCANVANLYLARAVGRRREVAVMRAMGASALRVARPLLFEALILAGCGAALGVGAAAALPALLRHIGAADLPRIDELTVDGRLLLIAVALALAVAAVAALAPAWSDARRGLRDTLASTAIRGSGPRGRSRRLLVVLQVAGTVALVFVAGLLLKSLRTLSRVDPGFDPSDGVAISLRLSSVGFTGADEAVAFQWQALESLAALPGVAEVGGVSMLPLDGGNLCDDASVEGLEARVRCVEYRSVTPGYFRAMGIDLLAGRGVTAADRGGAPPVVVVNRALARRFFGERPPIGGRLVGRGSTWEIVGVVEDVHHFGLDATPRAEAYLPFAQAPFPLLTLVARAQPGQRVSDAAIRDTLWSVEPRLALPEVRSLESLVASSIAAPRARGLLFTALGLVALVLSMGGIAGVLACDVHRRQREIGIRMALGGRAGAVRMLVLGDALQLAVAGLVVGAAAAALVGRWVQSFLFDVGVLDPGVAMATLAALAAAALLAAWAPARRATRVDPAVTLREE